jgi:hypothetical protein
MSNAATYPRYKITAKMRVEFSKVHKQVHMALKAQKGPVSLEEAKTQVKAHLKNKA